MNKNILSGWISLAVRNENIDKDFISNILGLKPSFNKHYTSEKLWMYKYRFEDLYNLDVCFTEFLKKFSSNDIRKIKEVYPEIYISLYVQSEYAQIELYISPDNLKKISNLDIELNISIISWGGADDN